MNIWGFIIGGAIGLIIIICIVSIGIENCEDKIEELENRIKFQDKSISELEKTASKYIELYRLVSTEMNRLIFRCSNLTDDIAKLKNNKKDKTEEDIINEELDKYSKQCDKAIKERLNRSDNND